jgi:hypothetical protein
VSVAALSDIAVTLNSTGNPETTRIDNTGSGSVTIYSIESLANVSASEPYTVNRTLGAGRTVIYRSGSGAVSGTILTTIEIYTNSRWDEDGVRLSTSAGTVTKRCAANPNPTPTPSQDVQLQVTVSCRTNPETVRIVNVGTTNATITTISSRNTPSSREPIRVDRKLGPGKTVIFRSGSGATTGTVLTTAFLFDDSAYENEGVIVRTTAGKTFSDRCDARPAPQLTPAPTNTPPPSGCDPSYPTVCIAPVSQVGDLDCGDIPYRRFTVRPPDPHRFDGDNDGIGCES